jgi:hypothetical protein
MLGRNKFIFNQATMCEAIRVYLDKIMIAQKLQIESVKWVGSPPDSFEIVLAEKTPNEK